jgi:hypothetical protein
MRELYTCQTPILSIEALSHTTLEILMANPTTTAVSATAPAYVDDSTAQFVYFDMAPTFGVFGGAIQIELASRILIPLPDGGVNIKFVATTRLRCSPAAAGHLRDALNAALKLLEQPQQEQVAAANKLN